MSIKGSMKVFQGFTLAEILITLVIIGVVAAITLPTLMQNYQKHVTVNRLKQTYSILEQAVKMSEIDNGYVSEWDYDINGEEFYSKYIKNYLKDVKSENLMIKSRNIQYNNAAGVLVNDMIFSDSYNVILSNGTLLSFGTGAEGYKPLGIDLNGTAAPNKVGRDWFLFLINKDGGLMPWGYGNYLYGLGKNPQRADILQNVNYGCSNSSSISRAGFYCALLIMYDGWKLAPEYPW